MAATILLSELVSAAQPESRQRISVNANAAPNCPAIVTPLLGFELHPVAGQHMRELGPSTAGNPDHSVCKCQSRATASSALRGSPMSAGNVPHTRFVFRSCTEMITSRG